MIIIFALIRGIQCYACLLGLRDCLQETKYDLVYRSLMNEPKGIELVRARIALQEMHLGAISQLFSSFGGAS